MRLRLRPKLYQLEIAFDKVLAAMPGIDNNGVIGDVKFDPKGDLREPVITLYDYKGGKKSTLAVQKI